MAIKVANRILREGFKTGADPLLVRVMLERTDIKPPRDIFPKKGNPGQERIQAFSVGYVRGSLRNASKQRDC